MPVAVCKPERRSPDFQYGGASSVPDNREVRVHIKEVRATRAGSSEMFTGAVYIDEITDRDLPSKIRVCQRSLKSRPVSLLGK